MKKINYFFIYIFLLLSQPVLAAEKLLQLDGSDWVLGWQDNASGRIFEEYVPKGENVESWNELFTIQFFPGLNKNTNPDVFEGVTKEKMTSICPTVQWTSISQTQDERFWTWTISNCPGQPDQSEIVRLKKTNQGFYLWHYAIKQSPISKDQEQKWLTILTQQPTHTP